MQHQPDLCAQLDSRGPGREMIFPVPPARGKSHGLFSAVTRGGAWIVAGSGSIDVPVCMAHPFEFASGRALSLRDKAGAHIARLAYIRATPHTERFAFDFIDLFGDRAVGFNSRDPI